MQKNLFNLLFVVSVLSASLSNAETFVDKYSTSKKFDLCTKISFATYDYVKCVNNELKIQDKLLNDNYRKTMKSLRKEKQSKLKKMQRTWIKYTNQKCSFSYDKYSGSGGLQDDVTCMLKETIKRAVELKELY